VDTYPLLEYNKNSLKNEILKLMKLFPDFKFTNTNLALEKLDKSI